MYPLTILAGVLVALLILLIHEFQKANKLKKQQEERNMMVALLSHRLRTPLTSIKWHTELLLNQEFGKLRIAQMELLDKVNSGIAEAIAILNTFLEVFRIEQGAIGSKSVMIDVWQSIEGVADEMKKAAGEKKQTIIYDRPAERVTAFMNPLMFHTIFEIILDNAITYTPTSGIIEVQVDVENNIPVVHVKDNGIGMSEDEQRKLFQKFFRAEKAKVIATNGNGLGLYLVKRMLTSIGADIRCKSVPNEGTTFTIVLPTDKN